MHANRELSIDRGGRRRGRVGRELAPDQIRVRYIADGEPHRKHRRRQRKRVPVVPRPRLS